MFRKALLLLLIHSALFGAPPPTLTWQGSTSSMAAPGNWDPEGPPAAGDTLVFPMGPTTSVTNDLGTYSLGNWSVANAYTFTGNNFLIRSQTSAVFTLTASGTNFNVDQVSLSAASSVWSISSVAGGNAITSPMTGPGQLTLTAGVLNLSGTNNYTGITTLAAGSGIVLKPTVNAALSPSSAFILGAGTTLNLNGTSPTIGGLGGDPASSSPMLAASSVVLGNQTLTIGLGNASIPFYGIISGMGGGVTLTGGTSTFMGANTYTGATTLQLGANLNTVDLGTSGSLIFSNGGGTVTFLSSFTYANGITLSGPGMFSTNSFNVTLTGTFTGSNPLYKLGLGTLFLNGPNAGGNYFIEAGVLKVTSSTIGLNPLTFQNSGGTLQAGNALSILQTITLNAPGTIDTNGNAVSVMNTISGPSDFIKTGTGTLTLANPTTYLGRTIIQDGTLSVAAANYSSAPSPYSQLVFALYPDGTAGSPIFQMGTAYTPLLSNVIFMADGTINTNATTSTISGIISGPSTSSFTVTGNGTLILTGANTYSGPTNVSTGILRAGVGQVSAVNSCSGLTAVASGAFGVNSDITVSAGATLDFQDFANTVGDISNSGTVLTSATITATSFSQTANPASTTLTIPSTGTPYGNFVTSGAIALNGTLTIPATSYTSSTNEIVLFESTATSGTVLTGTFQTTSIPANLGKINYDYAENKVYLGAATSCDGEWQTMGSGNWGSSINWVGGCIPGSGGAMDQDAAEFPDFSGQAGPYTITLQTSPVAGPLSVTLHDLTFDALTTKYVIQQFDATSQIILDKTAPDNSKPRINMSSTATVTINAPIVLNTDSRMILSSNTLTLGTSATITSQAASNSTLFISQGATSGALVNNGSITPYAVNMQGGTITNSVGKSLSSTATLAIGGLNGNSSTLTLTNNAAMNAGTAVTIGGAGGTTSIINASTGTIIAGTTFTIGDPTGTTTATNAGTLSSTGAFTINSGTVTNTGTVVSSDAFTINGGSVNNNSGGILHAAAGQTLTVAGGTLTNANGGVLGLSGSALALNGTSTSNATLITSAQIPATTYTQGQYGTLTLNFPTGSATPYGNILTSSAISLNSNLTVTDGAYSPPAGAEIVLLKSTGIGKQLSGTFTSVSLMGLVSGGHLSYDYSDNQVVLGFSQCNGDWSSTAFGNWANTANWVGGCAPGVTAPVMDTANFPNVAASQITVTLAVSGGGAPQSVTLHDLVFEAPTTVYTIQQFTSASQIILDKASMGNSKPRITMSAGNATINAPIVLNTDARIYLSGGQLTFGNATTVTNPTATTLYISEGTSAGTLINTGSITPTSVVIEGGTIVNSGAVSPAAGLTIAGLEGNASSLTITNSGTMTSGTTFSIGSGMGTTAVANTGTMQATTSFTISSGTVANNTGGQISASEGQTFSITGGQVTNASGATLGLDTANLTFSGGTLTNSGEVMAHNYTQNSPASLQLNVTNLTAFGSVNASGTAALGGSLVVNAQPGFSLTNGESVNLLTAANGLSAGFPSFSTVSFQNFPNTVIPNISYLANAVVLNLTEALVAHTTGGTTQIVFSAVNQHNALITQKCFQMQNRISQGVSESNVASAHSSSQDEFLASNQLVQNTPIRQKQGQLAEKVQQERTCFVPWNVYVAPVASFGHVKTVGDQIGIGYHSIGALAGCDHIATDTEQRSYFLGVGGILEFRKKTLVAEQGFGTSTIDRLHGSLYGTFIPKALPDLAIDAIVGFSYTWDHLQRKTGLNKQLTAFGSTHEKIWDFLLELEYTFSNRTFSRMPKSFTVTPLANIQYVRDHIDGYTERSAGVFDLKVGSQTPESLTTTLGFRADWFYTSRNFQFRFELDGGWQYQYLNMSDAVGFTAFNVANTPTLVSTVAPGRNSLLLAVDGLMTFRKGWQLEGTASYQLNKLFYDTFLYLGLGKEF